MLLCISYPSLCSLLFRNVEFKMKVLEKLFIYLQYGFSAAPNFRMTFQIDQVLPCYVHNGNTMCLQVSAERMYVFFEQIEFNVLFSGSRLDLICSIT